MNGNEVLEVIILPTKMAVRTFKEVETVRVKAMEEAGFIVVKVMLKEPSKLDLLQHIGKAIFDVVPEVMRLQVLSELCPKCESIELVAHTEGLECKECGFVGKAEEIQPEG